LRKCANAVEQAIVESGGLARVGVFRFRKRDLRGQDVFGAET
jgi:hypothetical protein